MAAISPRAGRTFRRGSSSAPITGRANGMPSWASGSDPMEGLTAQAAIVEAPGGEFTLASVTIDPPGPEQVRVTIHACGVCHTDMVMRDGGLPIPFPVILGHEGAGVVEA